MKRSLFFITFLFLVSSALFAQVSVNTDGSQADPSAGLDVKFDNKGFLLPRLSQSQIIAIPSPADGLQVYCTTDSKMYIFVASSNRWKEVAYGTGTMILPAVFSIGTGGSCDNTVIHGTYYSGNPLTTNEYVKIQLSVSIIGTYSIKTDTLNGYSFVATGLFSTTGTQNINLAGSGVPISVQTDQFTANTSNGGGTCIFSINTQVLPPCGFSMTINHLTTGGVAPVDKTVTYGTVTGIPGETSKCWITSNLGADHQATSVDDATESSAGWYWEFNRMQGYKHDGSTRTPNTTWISVNENSDWLPSNDPCALVFGSGWRIPTSTEWTNVAAGGSWNNWNGPWNSALKIHAAGHLYGCQSGNSLAYRGSDGRYSSSSEYDSNNRWYLNFNSSYCIITPSGDCGSKSDGHSVRCLRDN